MYTKELILILEEKGIYSVDEHALIISCFKAVQLFTML